MIWVSAMISVMNYALVNRALSSYICASKGVKVFLLLQFRIELWMENISRKGPLNRRSLGFARDDKGEGKRPMESGCRTQATQKSSVQQRLSMKPSPSPLSSRAKPRDLQFYGPFLESGC
jgi:hypothetical protein